MNTDKKLNIFAYSITATVVVISVLAWGQSLSWKLGSVNAYSFFPLLGLIAFSIMWTHYVTGALRKYLGVKKEVLAKYSEYTGFIVLAAILMHPGILIYQLMRDGQGLPPQSYVKFVAPNLAWAVMLGSLSLFIFLSYELKRKFSNSSWWHYVVYAQDFAMILIIIHSLKLGSVYNIMWFRYIWYLFAFSLVIILVNNYYQILSSRTK